MAFKTDTQNAEATEQLRRIRRDGVRLYAARSEDGAVKIKVHKATRGKLLPRHREAIAEHGKGIAALLQSEADAVSRYGAHVCTGCGGVDYLSPLPLAAAVYIRNQLEQGRDEAAIDREFCVTCGVRWRQGRDDVT